jgi:hypothetical protein
MSAQRDYMRKLVAQFGFDQERVCSAYALAEREGIVRRKSNQTALSAEDYARRLWLDGIRKGWLGQKSSK